MTWRGRALGAFSLIFLTTCSACSSRSSNPPDSATFVGRAACAPCHQQELAAYTGSDHDLAMDSATETTVLGDFNNRQVILQGVASRFYRKDGNFFVRTEGVNGEFGVFQIMYTFGVWPLQQYLVAFPGGRLQTLPLCWDARPAEAGGQRWFHIYGEERISSADELFWTRVSQNWNYQCAECHSTNLKKNYNAATRTYATSWSEIDVSCEACHGPGSRHVAWAESARRGDTLKWANLGLDVKLEHRSEVEWTFGPGDSIAHRTNPTQGTSQVDMCARCHSRRSTEREYVYGESLLETHRPALLEDPLYFPDGQIKDEVYEYGSFLQSKMYKAGVVCSDCHDAHSGKPYAQGDALCQRCHEAQTYATPAHHFHNVDSAGARCVGCHMPQHQYMVVDERADHSMRVPRPDLTVSLGVPNACNSCHSDRTATWAAKAYEKWFGPLPAHPFAETFAAARKGDPRAAEQLIALAADTGNPAFVRASSLQLLGTLGTTEQAAIRQGAQEADPLVRAAAADAATGLPVDLSREILWPLLKDSVRLVRTLAAHGLAELPRPATGTPEAALLDSTLSEYVRSQLHNADHPSSWMNIGNMYLASGDTERAKRAFETAIAVDSTFIPAYVNLADVFRVLHADTEGWRVLQAALGITPADAGASHSLGLLLIRQGRSDSALIFLERAVKQEPGNARYAYVYAEALHSMRRSDESASAVHRSLVDHPFDRNLLEMSLRLQMESGHREGALETVRRLRELFPGSEDYRTREAELLGS